MRKILILLIGLGLLLAGCGNTEDGETEQSGGDHTDQQLQLRNIDVKVEELDVQLDAEVNTLSDKIFYRVEQGDTVLQEESSIELTEDKEWKAFKIETTLAENVKEKEDAPIIVIYGKSENEEEINPNYIPVDIK